jgi:hypothetical protein
MDLTHGGASSSSSHGCPRCRAAVADTAARDNKADLFCTDCRAGGGRTALEVAKMYSERAALMWGPHFDKREEKVCRVLTPFDIPATFAAPPGKDWGTDCLGAAELAAFHAAPFEDKKRQLAAAYRGRSRQRTATAVYRARNGGPCCASYSWPPPNGCQVSRSAGRSPR